MEMKGVSLMQQINLFDYVLQLLELSDSLLRKIEENINILLKIINSNSISLSSFLFFFRNIEKFEFIGSSVVQAFEEEADSYDDILGVIN